MQILGYSGLGGGGVFSLGFRDSGGNLKIWVFRLVCGLFGLIGEPSIWGLNLGSLFSITDRRHHRTTWNRET